jgi:hypothetical protein
MPRQPKQPSPSNAAFVVLHETARGRWRVIAEVPRRPGLPARTARAQAVRDAIGREPAPGARYAAVLRSEWRIAAEF